MPATICAIIPTFNRASLLRECIDSILAQTRMVDQIIVVNDGSTDDTEKVVKSYGNRLSLISKPNGGKSSALNFGLKQCAADYVWICDDDDIALPDAVANLAAALDADPSVEVVFGTYRMFRDKQGQRTYTTPPNWLRGDEKSLKLALLERNLMLQFATLVRRSVYEKVGPFREDLVRSQDYDMALRFARQANIKHIPEIIFYQRMHDGTRGSATDLFNVEKSYEKWMAYDRNIFAEARNEFYLSDFIPAYALSWNKTESNRAALVKRATIYAFKGIWDFAIADIREASQMATGSAKKETIDLIESSFDNSYAWETLRQNRQWIAELHKIYSMNNYGRSIIFALSRPLIWRLRQTILTGRIADALKVLGLLLGILGLWGTVRRVMASALN